MDGLGRKGERERDEGEVMVLWEIGNLDSDGFLLEKWKGWESWDLG